MKFPVAVDFSDVTDKIINAVKSVALNTNAGIWLIHVVQPEPDFIGYEVGPPSHRHIIAQKFQEKHVQIQELAESLKKDGLIVTPLLVQGPTVETIMSETEKLKPDIIITASHGHGAMSHLWMGSVSKGILRKSSVPVLVVPA